MDNNGNEKGFDGIKGESALYNGFFKFAEAVVIFNAVFVFLHILYTTIRTAMVFGFMNFAVFMQPVLFGLLVLLLSFWLAMHLKNPYIVWFLIFFYIATIVLKNVKTVTSADIKYMLRTFYPVIALKDANPLFNYLFQHIITDEGVFYERVSIYREYPLSTALAFISAGLYTLVLLLVVLIHLFALIRHMINKIWVKLDESHGTFGSTPYNKANFTGLFTKRKLLIFTLGWLLASTWSYVNMEGYWQTITITPPEKTGDVSISTYGMPAELVKDNLNKTWIDNTTEGRAFVNQLARHNFMAYIHISPSQINTTEKASDMAEYIDYLYRHGIRVSVDGWCNIKHYYDSWLPMFKAIIEFRTNPLYKDKLKGLVGISGDFEPNPVSGFNKTLFNEIYENVTGELEWMKEKLEAAGLGPEDFKFGTISGVYTDLIDNDYDMQMISENWFILDYEFDAPMFYRDGLWMYDLYRTFQLYSWEHEKYFPNIENRVLLGITGRGRYQSKFGLDAVVKEINIARSFGVTNIGFYFGYADEGLLYCFEGLNVSVNGTTVMVTKYNVLDILMYFVYQNEPFTIRVKLIPDRLPEEDLGTSENNKATHYKDNANLDVGNLVGPLYSQFGDFLYNLDHGDPWVICEIIASVLFVWIYFKFIRKPLFDYMEKR